MKKYLFLLLLIPTLLFPQNKGFRGSGGGTSISSLLPIIADSTYLHKQGTTPDTLVTDGALPVKLSGLLVTGNTELRGNLRMATIATEQVLLGTGSNAAPELSSVGDPNTGIRFPGSDITTFVQGGDTKLTILSSGGALFPVSTNQLQFGSSSNYVTSIEHRNTSSSGFTINCTHASSSIVFKPGNSEAGRFIASGNLGLGTATPQAKLSVVGADGTGTGIHLVSTFNIKRDSWAQAVDTSSVAVRIDSAHNPRIGFSAADGDSARIHVRTDSTVFYSKNPIALDGLNVRIGTSNFAVTKVDTIFTAGYKPRWVKFTSGAKTWYSPVYADTTGKW